MKKFLIYSIVIIFVLPLLLMAQPQQQNPQAPSMNQMNMPAGPQMGMPWNQMNMPAGSQMGMPCGHCGMMMHGMMANPITDSQAKEMFNNYIENNNLKGYSITSIKMYNSHMGPMYRAELKDASGNLFTLIISYGGMVRGPFPTSEVK